MNLCSDVHDEVCFEGRHCPVCPLYEEIGRLTIEIEDLQEKLSVLKRKDL